MARKVELKKTNIVEDILPYKEKPYLKYLISGILVENIYLYKVIEVNNTEISTVEFCQCDIETEYIKKLIFPFCIKITLTEITDPFLPSTKDLCGKMVNTIIFNIILNLNEIQIDKLEIQLVTTQGKNNRETQEVPFVISSFLDITKPFCQQERKKFIAPLNSNIIDVDIVKVLELLKIDNDAIKFIQLYDFLMQKCGGTQNKVDEKIRQLGLISKYNIKDRINSKNVQTGKISKVTQITYLRNQIGHAIGINTSRDYKECEQVISGKMNAFIKIIYDVLSAKNV